MKPLGWIIILLLCAANFLTAFAQKKDLLISSEEISLVNMEKKQDYEHARKRRAAEEITLAGKGQKGKGSYGGANMVHRKPGDKGAATSYKPCFFILFAALLGFSFIP